MNKAAVTKAESRLRLARTHAAAIATCETHDEFEATWYQFLVTYKNVYTALEQGAKDSAQSRQWFGGKKAERRDDPLLQYLFQARDADEHGLEPVSEFVRGKTRLGVPHPGVSKDMLIKSMVVRRGEVRANIESPDGLVVERTPPHFKLVPVTGRGPVTYPVPTVHLRQPLADAEPTTFAQLAIDYLSGMLEEARARAA